MLQRKNVNIKTWEKYFKLKNHRNTQIVTKPSMNIIVDEDSSDEENEDFFTDQVFIRQPSLDKLFIRIKQDLRFFDLNCGPYFKSNVNL